MTKLLTQSNSGLSRRELTNSATTVSVVAIDKAVVTIGSQNPVPCTRRGKYLGYFVCLFYQVWQGRIRHIPVILIAVASFVTVEVVDHPHRCSCDDGVAKPRPRTTVHRRRVRVHNVAVNICTLDQPKILWGGIFSNKGSGALGGCSGNGGKSKRPEKRDQRG